MAEDRLNELRNNIFRACQGYGADEAVRALGSALTSLIIGCTKDRGAALAAVDRLHAAMRSLVEEAARPPNAVKQ